MEEMNPTANTIEKYVIPGFVASFRIPSKPFPWIHLKQQVQRFVGSRWKIVSLKSTDFRWNKSAHPQPGARNRCERSDRPSYYCALLAPQIRSGKKTYAIRVPISMECGDFNLRANTKSCQGQRPIRTRGSQT